MSTAPTPPENPRHETLLQRIEELGSITDEPGCLTRAFLSPALQRAHDTIRSWLDPERFTIRTDPAANLRIRHRRSAPDQPTLLMGSHLDTVRNAGKYDGPLGFLLALATFEAAQPDTLPFALEVIGFSDEEGLRYQTAYLGSSYLAGTFQPGWLQLRDSQGISMEQAFRFWGFDPDALLQPPELPPIIGYLEAHIEQGPVLETLGLPCGAVSSIAGQNRIATIIRGKASHAGTTPLPLRQDALAGAAELISLLEDFARRDPDLRATVGAIENHPNASNVIPEWTRLSLDLRHPRLDALDDASERIHTLATALVERRKLRLSWDYLMRKAPVPCDPTLTRALQAALEETQGQAPLLTSGAGHDAVPMATLAPIAMLFVRCREGLSHHPDEYASPADLAAALHTYERTLQHIARQTG